MLEFNEILIWLEQNPEWVAFGIIGASFIESFALIGIIIPGVVLLAVIAGLASTSLSVYEVVLLAYLASFFSDITSYFIGFSLRNSLAKIWPFNKHPKLLANGKAFFQKYGMSYDQYLLLNSFKPKGDLLKENAYMALLHRGIKPTESDYIKRGIKTPEQKKIFDQRVKRVESYVRKHPDKLMFVMKRYPKNDPRLSMLNYKMDRMTEANDKYLDTQFPTNQALFTKVKDRTKKNMNLTDPKNFKPVKDPIKYVDVKKTKKLKETVTRHFNKPVKSKSMFGLNMGKVRKTNQKMIEKREQEQRIKEEDKAYIEERMSRQKSNWKDDLTTL